MGLPDTSTYTTRELVSCLVAWYLVALRMRGRRNLRSEPVLRRRRLSELVVHRSDFVVLAFRMLQPCRRLGPRVFLLASPGSMSSSSSCASSLHRRHLSRAAVLSLGRSSALPVVVHDADQLAIGGGHQLVDQAPLGANPRDAGPEVHPGALQLSRDPPHIREQPRRVVSAQCHYRANRPTANASSPQSQRMTTEQTPGAENPTAARTQPSPTLRPCNHLPVARLRTSTETGRGLEHSYLCHCRRARFFQMRCS